MGLIDQIIGVESGGDNYAKNPNSSALGPSQFINSTWLDTIKSARPDIAQGKSDQELLALRTDPQLSREMTAAYAAKNGQILSQAGYEATPGNTYLAHFAGPKGAVSVLSADPNTPVSQVLTPEAVKANPFLARMTAGDLLAWADRKMGGAQPVPATPVAASGGLLQQASAPLQIAPQAAPVFPMASPQATPQQAQPDIFSQMQTPQAAPIFYAPRKAPDLRGLQAALKAPIFKRG